MVMGQSRSAALYLASCISLLFFAGAVSGQQIIVRASTDKIQYRVGDYISYTITVDCDKGSKIYPPVFVTDSLKSVLLIQKQKPVEEEENGRASVTFKYTLAGYDSAGVVIPSVAVPYQTPADSTTRFAYTNTTSFTVSTLKVNPQGEIKDVKPPIKIPFNWKLVLFWSLVALFVIGVLLYAYLQRRKRHTKSHPEERAMELPSYVIAMNSLRELEQQRLWQKGMIKEYHSAITEIIRQYFEDRFEMPALELPTSEAIELLQRNGDSEPILETAYSFLSNADLVKFAKFTPLDSVNEEMMKQAYEIVKKTIPVSEVKTDSSQNLRQEVNSGIERGPSDAG